MEVRCNFTPAAGVSSEIVRTRKAGGQVLFEWDACSLNGLRNKNRLQHGIVSLLEDIVLD